MKNFPEQLLAARKASGLTQEQLAEQLNVSRPMISHWETGRSLPDLETVRRLSQILEYNFLQESEREFAAQPEAADTLQENHTAPKRRRTALLGFLIGVAATAAAALLIFLPMRPQSAPAQGTSQPLSKPFVKTGGHARVVQGTQQASGGPGVPDHDIPRRPAESHHIRGRRSDLAV